MARLSTHYSLQDPRLGGIAIELLNIQTLPAAGNLTYTAANIMGGFIIRGGSLSASVTDTLPSAAALCEANQGVMVGSSFQIPIRNAAAGAYTITIAPGPGCTMFDPAGTNRQIPQNNTKFFLFVFTNVTVGQEAYTVYSFGASTT